MMIYKLLLFLITVLSSSYSQNSYSLEDINPNSDTYGSTVGIDYFEGKVLLHYFGAFT